MRKDTEVGKIVSRGVRKVVKGCQGLKSDGNVASILPHVFGCDRLQENL